MPNWDLGLKVITICAEPYSAISNLTCPLDSPLEEVLAALHRHHVGLIAPALAVQAFLWVYVLRYVYEGSSSWFEHFNYLK